MIKKVKLNDTELNPDIKAEEKSVERKSYKVYSDVLNRVFNTVEDLEAAEQEYARQQEEKERLQREKERQVAELKEKRAARAKEIEDALKERDALDKKINERISPPGEDGKSGYGYSSYSFKKLKYRHDGQVLEA